MKRRERGCVPATRYCGWMSRDEKRSGTVTSSILRKLDVADVVDCLRFGSSDLAIKKHK